ncbi:FAD-binding oxidoreductase [Dactylosporangium vinaceum]|uniref:D-amino-acid oxidase n=1 Tax=Dactylosporangium vinaceum TaxID=53362 RepID=A0ABV5MIJ5_9ACTN|nr:FAD-dependent oxidoreductase [Dactylosporangium vinaceum]UAB97629.1 FAD-binding oxidoreductase [Dactylosporangium vinaceum]
MAWPDILIIGAGVSGLTTAAHLAERGHSVHLIADREPRQTTSAVAGAIWGPYLVGDDECLSWAEATRPELERIAEEDKTSGVRMAAGLELSVKADPPDWARPTRNFRPCPEELRRFPSKYRSAWRYTVPLVDMPIYLDYLLKRNENAGVKLDLHHPRLRSLDEVRGMAEFVVNCTGLGARDLVPDPDMYAIKGLLIEVKNPGIEEFFQEDAPGTDLTYIFPHKDHVLLGGHFAELCESEEPRRKVAAAILKRCVEVEPKLREATQTGYRIGLRPARRPKPRVEFDAHDGSVIHNYGHGAAGLSLSWGCAQKVGRLLT